jgi:hypothetical protein
MWNAIGHDNQIKTKVFVYKRYAAIRDFVQPRYTSTRRFVTRHLLGRPIQMPPLYEKPEMVQADGDSIPAPMAMAFDSQNRPYWISADYGNHFGYIYTQRQDKWQRFSFRDELLQKHPNTLLTSDRFMVYGSMTIDDHDRLYAIVYKLPWQPVLVFSPDLCNTFQIYELPEKPNRAFLETFTGHNVLNHPPVIGMIRKIKDHPARFSNYHHFSVLIPVADDNGLDLTHWVHISDSANGFSTFAGGYSFAVTTGDKTHITWAGTTAERFAGNPIYAATLDRKQYNVVAERFVTTATPKELDGHVTPVIVSDSKGFLHLVTGSHIRPFLYLKSLHTDCIDQGWTDPISMGDRQTYAALVCNSQDDLYCLFREHPILYYQKINSEATEWQRYKELVLPPEDYRLDNKDGYTNFLHKVFLDRKDNLFVSYSMTVNNKDFPVSYYCVYTQNKALTFKRFTSHHLI